MDDEHEGLRNEQRHRLEVPICIVRRLCFRVWQQRVRCMTRDEQSVPVRCGFRDEIRAYDRAATGPVFRDHRLAEWLRKLLRDDTADEVHPPPGV